MKLLKYQVKMEKQAWRNKKKRGLSKRLLIFIYWEESNRRIAKLSGYQKRKVAKAGGRNDADDASIIPLITIKLIPHKYLEMHITKIARVVYLTKTLTLHNFTVSTTVTSGSRASENVQVNSQILASPTYDPIWPTYQSSDFWKLEWKTYQLFHIR